MNHALAPTTTPPAAGLPARLHNAVIDGVTALLALTWDYRTKPKMEDHAALCAGWVGAVGHVVYHGGLDAAELAPAVSAAFAELCALSARDRPWPSPHELLRRAVPGPVLLKMSREEAEAEQSVAKLPEAQVAAEQARLDTRRREDEAAAARAAETGRQAARAAGMVPTGDTRARMRALKLEQTVRASLIAQREARSGRVGALLKSPDPLDRINGLRLVRGLLPLERLPPEHEENTRRRAAGAPTLLHADSDARAAAQPAEVEK